jgi:hypothetical protein
MPTLSKDTSVAGAGFGAAVGTLVLYGVERGLGDLPTTVDGALVLVVTVIVAAVWPASREA